MVGADHDILMASCLCEHQRAITIASTAKVASGSHWERVWPFPISSRAADSVGADDDPLSHLNHWRPCLEGGDKLRQQGVESG